MEIPTEDDIDWSQFFPDPEPERIYLDSVDRELAATLTLEHIQEQNIQ